MKLPRVLLLNVGEKHAAVALSNRKIRNQVRRTINYDNGFCDFSLIDTKRKIRVDLLKAFKV